MVGGWQISDVFNGRAADFLSAEEADMAGPSDFIMTRGNRDDEEEAASDSDTDDVDHKGEKTNQGMVSSFGRSLKGESALCSSDRGE